MKTEARFNRIWYGRKAPSWWMRGLASLFAGLVAVRRFLYRIGIMRQARFPVPVIVIGNITAGGTGKTPLAIHLVERLKDFKLEAGLVSRGYRGRPGREPVMVSAWTSTEIAGDEPVLLATRTGVPLAVHPRRAKAVAALLEEHAVDVIICDDGLQHYALARDIEIAVVDGERGLGNQRMLPAGPLREPVSRLSTVDFIVVNGKADLVPAELARTRMRLAPVALVNVRNGERRLPDALVDDNCVAVAGIGNPQRFFSTLGELGYSAECRAFSDHHAFDVEDLAFAATRPVLMTEKDAVKCRDFAGKNWWYLEVAAALEDDLAGKIVQRLGIINTRRTETVK